MLLMIHCTAALASFSDSISFYFRNGVLTQIESVVSGANVLCRPYQVIPGNDQNTSPTNQKTAGGYLERTS